MPLAIPALDRGRGRILEDRHRIARLQVASKHALPHDQRLVVGAVVIGDVDLVEPAAQARELKRGGSYFYSPVLASHPEARVAGGDEELRPRRGHALRSTSHEREDEERDEAGHAPPI